MLSFSKYSLRESLILLNTSSVDYYKRIELNNKLLDEDSPNPINSSQLSYEGSAKVDKLVNMAIDKDTASSSQHIGNKIPALKRAPKPYGKGKDKWIESIKPIPSEHTSNSIYNIQILYNVNQAIDLELWNGNFNSILLHRSIEHLATDINNIKESL